MARSSGDAFSSCPRLALTSLFALATLVSAGGALLGCSDDRQLAIDVMTGQESDAFSRDPPVVVVEVRAEGESSEGPISRTVETKPGGDFDLGGVPVDALLSFDVRGFDAAGEVVVRGRSLPVQIGSVGGDQIPVFVQRMGTWARPPGGLPRSHVEAPTGVLAERFLFSTGGTSAADESGAADAAGGDFYDLLSFGGSESAVPLPRVAESMVFRGTQALVIDKSGASLVDFELGTSATVDLPDGLPAFGDVAGGRLVESEDGSTYVVGATRSGAPTAAVLRVGPDGALEGLRLREARAGAAAVWVPDLGLAVVGGSSADPGVELLSEGSSSFAATPFPADEVEGAGAVASGGSSITVLGGSAGGASAATRVLDLSCVADCQPEVLDEVLFDVPLLAVQAFALLDGTALVIGQDGDDGTTRTFLVELTGDGLVELPLREPRRGATATPAPNGTLVIMGGTTDEGTGVSSVEMFFPP